MELIAVFDLQADPDKMSQILDSVAHQCKFPFSLRLEEDDFYEENGNTELIVAETSAVFAKECAERGNLALRMRKRPPLMQFICR